MVPAALRLGERASPSPAVSSRYGAELEELMLMLPLCECRGSSDAERTCSSGMSVRRALEAVLPTGYEPISARFKTLMKPQACTRRTV